MEKVSLQDVMNNPVIKEPFFRSWLKTQKDLAPEEALKLYSDSFAGKKEGRLYMDGAFDVVHSGHYNAIRQAKELCHTLVVGVNSDQDILKHKGPPIMDIKERATLVEACKWTDEVAADTPYVPDLELIDKLNCQCVAHGDDIIYGPDGKSIYSPFEDAGRMR